MVLLADGPVGRTGKADFSDPVSEARLAKKRLVESFRQRILRHCYPSGFDLETIYKNMDLNENGLVSCSEFEIGLDELCFDTRKAGLGSPRQIFQAMDRRLE